MADHELSIADKIKIAAQFLLTSPPGEVNEVLNDIRSLVNDDDALQEGITPALEQYNTEQLLTVTVPEVEHPVIISKYNQIDATHFIDPRSQQTFKFDHLRQMANEPQPHTVHEATEELRAAMDKLVEQYVADHYPDGASLTIGQDNQLTILVVSNKFNPDNFWNGRWRAVWTLDLATCELKGTAKVVVHYYEDGNVQLNSNKDFTFELDQALQSDSEALASATLRKIKQTEKEFQLALNNGYHQLSESTFKGLRRNLPVTRNKVDWDKILGYKLGSELQTREQ